MMMSGRGRSPGPHRRVCVAPEEGNARSVSESGLEHFRIFVEQEFSSFCGSEFICLATPPDPYGQQVGSSAAPRERTRCGDASAPPPPPPNEERENEERHAVRE